MGDYFDQDHVSEFQSNPMNEPKRVCVSCGTIETPLWRSGPEGPKSMCNACGIKWKRKTGSGKKRQRDGATATAGSSSSKKAKLAKLANGTHVRANGHDDHSSSELDDEYDDGYTYESSEDNDNNSSGANNIDEASTLLTTNLTNAMVNRRPSHGVEMVVTPGTISSALVSPPLVHHHQTTLSLLPSLTTPQSTPPLSYKFLHQTPPSAAAEFIMRHTSPNLNIDRPTSSSSNSSISSTASSNVSVVPQQTSPQSMSMAILINGTNLNDTQSSGMAYRSHPSMPSAAAASTVATAITSEHQPLFVAPPFPTPFPDQTLSNGAAVARRSSFPGPLSINGVVSEHDIGGASHTSNTLINSTNHHFPSQPARRPSMPYVAAPTQAMKRRFSVPTALESSEPRDQQIRSFIQCANYELSQLHQEIQHNSQKDQLRDRVRQLEQQVQQREHAFNNMYQYLQRMATEQGFPMPPIDTFKNN